MVQEGVTTAIYDVAEPAKTSELHHGSHGDLLDRPQQASVEPSVVDAIIVPTARKSANLDGAISLAAQLKCTLVALCSKWASATETIARAEGAAVAAVDIGRAPSGLVPSFACDKLLADTVFQRRHDTSLKR